MEKDSKIYVAGHRGMVGSAIVRELQRQGYTNIITCTHSELDLTRQEAVERFFAEEKPEYVFLAAAKVGGIVANQSALADFMYDNMILEMNVIHSAWKNGCRKLEFLGSSCIYPRMAPQPMKESCLLTSELEKTNEAYALAKISGLKYCEFLNRQYGTNYIAVMPTNLYGPNDNFHLENSHVMPAMMRKVYLSKCLMENDWRSVRRDMDIRPVEGVNGTAEEADILRVLGKYGIEKGRVTLWGTGKPLREFLWSEEMADACVYLLENINFSDIIGIREYSSALQNGGQTVRKPDYGKVDRNVSEGRYGAIPQLGEIRNCHINVGTGKELTIRELAELVVKTVGFKGELKFDATKPDGTPRKLIDVSKLHRLGWCHKIEIDEGVRKLFEWYQESLK
jgi:GDP-L-fucose synthase